MRTVSNKPDNYGAEQRWARPTAGADGDTVPLYLLPRRPQGRQAEQGDAETNQSPSLWANIRKSLDRAMVHWTLVYFAGAWLVLQMMDVLTNIWGWPVSVQRVGCLVLALGLLPALVIAWFHGERGRQQVTALEVIIVGTLLFASGAVVWAVCVT